VSGGGGVCCPPDPFLAMHAWMHSLLQLLCELAPAEPAEEMGQARFWVVRVCAKKRAHSISFLSLVHSSWVYLYAYFYIQLGVLARGV